MLLVAWFLCLAINTHAIASQKDYSTKNGIKYPNKMSEKSTHFVLNGLGTRTYYYVDVYVAGLYVTELSSNADEILKQKTPKIIRMHYFRDISKSDMIKVWKLSLNEACKPNCETYQKAFQDFEESIIDIKEGTEISFYFDSQFVEVRNPEKTFKITKENFDQILLSTWIGSNPPTEKLKNGLLGK